MSPPDFPYSDSPLVHRKRMHYGSKKLSFAGGALLITIILLILTIQLGGHLPDFPSFSSSGETTTNTKTDSDSKPTPIPHTEPSTKLSTEKLAAIVETRPLDNLIPILLHFSAVLGPSWPIHIFTTEAVNRNQLAKSLSFKRGVEAGRFRVRALPEDVTLNTHFSVSTFFTSPWFWQATAPAEHVLMFQADSILCSNSPQSVDDFLEYDFVGAPIDDTRNLGMGYNGGLSIRNRSMCADIVRTRNWQEERLGDHEHGNVDYEDQWFAKAMREIPMKADGKPGANLPRKEIAMKFAVETIWYDKPLGFHQANVWQADKMEDVYRWCPEYKMCTLDTFTDHSLGPS